MLRGRREAGESVHDWYATIPDRKPRWFWWHPTPSLSKARIVVTAVGLAAIAAGTLALITAVV